MGFSYSAPHMIFIITFVLVSLHFSHILPVDGRRERETSIEKVSGRDDNEEKEPLIFEKFRALLGLESFRRSSNGDLEDGSPSPAPSPAIEAPAPAPVRLTHGHSHHRPIAKLPRIHKEINGDQDNNRGRKILAATLASAGVTFLLCGIGFIWACQNFRKRKKRSSACTDEGRSKYVNSQNSVKKVTSDPGPDIFYLDSIGTALEPHPFCLKQNSEIVSTYSCQNTSICTLLKQEEGEESKQEKIESEHDNDCEIVSVHENGESAHYEPDGGSSSSGDEIVFTEAHSSDDESFHSFCDSHSSNARLSNASACSLGENSESFSSQVPSSMEKNTPTGPCSSSNQNNFVPPLPPPPPPPPPPLPRHHISVSPSQSLSLSTQIAPRGQSSSTLPNLSPPRNSKFSSVSNRTPESDLRPTGDIPPPPCPPPFPKGISNNTKTPPPPPSQFPQYASLGKDGSPLPKLKPLHWDKVRAAPDRTMVWDKLRSSSFELDEKMIESLFGYNLQNSMKNDETKNKSPSPSKHVLDPKRLQNITILSKALNVTPEHVCDALMQGSGLCLQQLEALIKMEPTKEEAAKLSSYKGDIGELGSAEKFVKTMLNIPFAFSRIEAMLYRETFEDEVVHLRKSFLMLQEACKELKSSRLFLKLLEAVLKTGNRMNVGTIRGGARAFKLDTLLKLSDVKGTDGRTTLLHFVVQEIVRSEGIRVSESIIGKINLKNKRKNAEDKEEDYRRMGLELVSGLSTELLNVKKTATIDLDVIASSVSNLSDGMAKLKNLVHNDLCMDTKNRDFVQSMRSFLNEAEKNLKELQEDEDRVLLHVREITEYFHGSMSKDESNPLRIFVIVRDFLGMLDHVCKELRSLKIPRSPNPLAPFR